MVRRGYEITVIAVWGGEKEEIIPPPFNIIYLINKIHLVNLIFTIFKHGLKSIKHFKILVRYLGFRDSLKYFSNYLIFEKLGADRIHAHFASNAALKGYLASKFLNIPFSCTGHGSELLLYPEPYLKELILNSKPFITISQYNKRFLVEKFKIPTEKIEVNYCGIYLDKFKRVERKKRAIYSILSVTALRDIKGVSYLIDACKLLKDQGFSFTCNIIGGGELYNNLFQHIEDMDLHNDVHLLGVIKNENLISYYNSTDIFVLPSLSESMGVVNMEALACELPVIATDVRGVHELIIDGYTGFLIEPANSNELAEKIIYCYKHPEIIEKLGQNGRKIVQQNFNLKKNVTKFEKLIKCETTDR